jgi:hypothetical protein
MITPERFLRFAAECEVMAKFTASPENRMAWHQIAERWQRCAAVIEKQDRRERPARKTARQVRVST